MKRSWCRRPSRGPPKSMKAPKGVTPRTLPATRMPTVRSDSWYCCAAQGSTSGQNPRCPGGVARMHVLGSVPALYVLDSDAGSQAWDQPPMHSPGLGRPCRMGLHSCWLPMQEATSVLRQSDAGTRPTRGADSPGCLSSRGTLIREMHNDGTQQHCQAMHPGACLLAGRARGGAADALPLGGALLAGLQLGEGHLAPALVVKLVLVQDAHLDGVPDREVWGTLHARSSRAGCHHAGPEDFRAQWVGMQLDVVSIAASLHVSCTCCQRKAAGA